MQFFSGLAFSGAFLSAMFPIPGLTLAPCIPFFIYLLFNLKSSDKRNFPVGVLLLALMSFYYIAYLPSINERYINATLIRLGYFYVLVFIFVVGKATHNPREFMSGFWCLIIPSAIISSAFGILKVVLQERGLIIGPLWFFFKDTSFGYPYGSSLITDYNIYCVALLVALSGIFLRVIGREKGVDFLSVFFSLLIALSIYVGGSRRSYFLFAFLCCLFFIYVLTYRRDLTIKFSISFVLFLGVVHCASDFIVTSASFDFYKVIYLFGGSEFISGDRIFTYRLFDLIGSMSMGNSFGLAERIERWKFALELFQSHGWVFGQGFTYQDLYSCKFVKCKHIDYPHNVFLSEWLLAGLLGLSSVVALAVFVLRAAVSGWRKMLYLGVIFILCMVLPSALISGDGVFSVPQVVVSLMMAFLCSGREINS